VRLVLVVVALALLACGGGGDGDGGDAVLSVEDARRAVARAVLDADDLGDGWDEDGAAEGPLDGCLAGPEDVLAEPTTVRFAREVDVFTRTLVTVSTVALESTGAIDDLFVAFRDDGVGPCVARAVQTDLGDRALDVGEPEVEDDYVVLDGVRSAHLTVPLRGPRYEIEIDVVLVSRGQLASTLVTVQLGGSVDGESVVRWATLLADRQRLDT